MTEIWRKQTAPSLENIEAIAREVFAALPQEFRTLCGNVVIHIADFADDDILLDLGIEDPFELTGLYEGVDVTSLSVDDIPHGPNHVHLYRQPMLAEWIDNGEVTIEELVRHILIHEIGHHFGLSDDDMETIEQAE